MTPAELDDGVPPAPESPELVGDPGALRSPRRQRHRGLCPFEEQAALQIGLDIEVGWAKVHVLFLF